MDREGLSVVLALCFCRSQLDADVRLFVVVACSARGAEVLAAKQAEGGRQKINRIQNHAAARRRPSILLFRSFNALGSAAANLSF